MEQEPATPDLEIEQAIKLMNPEERLQLKRDCLDNITSNEEVMAMVDRAFENEGLEPVTIIY